MAPRVLLDATAVPADRGGVGRYVDGLVAALDTARAELVVVSQRSDADRYRTLAPSATVVPGPTAVTHRPARLAWEQTGLPVLAEQLHVDVIHSPYYTMPLRAPVPVVVTVHDVTWASEPGLHSPLRSGAYRSATRTALRRAARCIVPSEATRDEMVALLDADPEHVEVIPHGVDLATFHPPTPEERRRVSDRLGLRGQRYVAFLGALDRRKSVPELIAGWVRAVSDLAQPPALVLAGTGGWDDEVDAAISAVPPHLRVVRPGYLRPSDLRGLLGGAVVVAHPSRTEGFGLPLLEAMACGAAVLASRHRASPEVGGDAVAYAESDEEGIAAGLRALLDDEAERARLAQAAVARAREFTWERSAHRHLEVYAAATAPVPA